MSKYLKLMDGFFVCVLMLTGVWYVSAVFQIVGHMI